MTVSTHTSKASVRSRAEARARILQATRDELAESGWRKFSVDKVARTAKASKQTIYRWWPSISKMCLEAGLELIPEAHQQGRDPVERIAALIQPLETAVRTGAGHSVIRAALIAASDDAAAAEVWRAWLKDHIRHPLRLILAELATRKVLRRDVDLDSAVELLTGSLWTRLLILRAPLPEDFSQTQAAILLREFAA